MGRYNISVKIVDFDGYEIIATTYFDVINSPPEVESITYSDNNIYRILDEDLPIIGYLANITFIVNITDVEDSWSNEKGNHSDSVSLTIRHTDPYRDNIEDESPQVTPIKMDLNLLYAGNVTNGNIETWVGQYQVNETVDGEKFYAGELTVIANATDSEGSFDIETGSPLIVENYAPQKHKIKDSSLDMKDSEYFYFDDEFDFDKEDKIKLYVFASDKEGLSKIKLWFFPFTGEEGGQELRDKMITISYDIEDLDTESMGNGVTRYKLTIKKSILPDDTIKIEFNDLVIYDNDYGFKHDEDYGKTFVQIKEIKDEEITFVNIPEIVGPPILIYIFIGIGIAALVSIVVVGAIYYRKRTGYRKFLD